MKPDAIVFSKEVLWRLARLQADINETKVLVMEVIIHQTGTTAEKLQAKWKSDSKKMAMEIYLKALKDAGLPEDTDPNEDRNGHRP
jgi:hypoxanthine-guanine phosphoribosyltransferase